LPQFKQPTGFSIPLFCNGRVVGTTPLLVVATDGSTEDPIGATSTVFGAADELGTDLPEVGTGGSIGLVGIDVLTMVV
jgi:hypothetical protein